MGGGHKDYSGTPLWKKLGIAPGARVWVLDPAPDLDVVLAFVNRADALRRRFPLLARSIAPAGRLWIAWPKKAARIATDVDFEVVQTLGLDAGLVDNKSASITEVFQGLQFVRRTEDRPR
jgi:hypothetical protein